MNVIISNASQEPIYQQIVDQVKALVFAGELNEGEALPSIRSLARDLQISVITTKRAYEELEKDGFIETVPGKGSFVASQNPELLRERRLSILESKLVEAISESKLLNLSLDELIELVRLLYQEES